MVLIQQIHHMLIFTHTIWQTLITIVLTLNCTLTVTGVYINGKTTTSLTLNNTNHIYLLPMELKYLIVIAIFKHMEEIMVHMISMLTFFSNRLVSGG